MNTEVTKEAPTVEEAVDAALEELGVQQDAVEYEVLQEPGKRVFGLGSDKAAKVRVWIKSDAAKEIARAHAEVLGGDDDEGDDALGGANSPRRSLSEPQEDLSDEELDQVADTAVAALREILAKFEISEPTIEEYEGDEGEIILDVVGGDLGLLIGRHGRTLDALQTAVGAITTRQMGFRHPVVVDIEGYRHRRRQKIEDIARRAAEKAARQRMPVRLRPMTPYERRIVHVALREDGRVVTASEGTEPYRQVVIKPR